MASKITEVSLFNAYVNYEEERQRHNRQVNYTQDSSFFQGKKKSCPVLLGVVYTTITVILMYLRSKIFFGSLVTVTEFLIDR